MALLTLRQDSDLQRQGDAVHIRHLGIQQNEWPASVGAGQT